MATQNAIDTNKPIEVSDGGTGVATLTDHGVLVGSGTAAITPIAVGTTGQLLIGVGNGDPAFGVTADSSFIFTTASAGTMRTLTVSNTDNTNAVSNAKLQLTTGGSSGGDPFITFTVTGQQSYSLGLDNLYTTPDPDEDDFFRISTTTALGGANDAFVLRPTGEINLPLQPSFLTYNDTDRNNVTGDGTPHTCIFNAEIYDSNNDFDGTSTFTAPVTGRYHFSYGIPLGGLTAAHQGYVDLNASNRTITLANLLIGVMKTSADRAQYFGNAYVDMDAADTVTFSITLSGGALVVDQRGNGAATTLSAFLGGRLVC